MVETGKKEGSARNAKLGGGSAQRETAELLRRGGINPKRNCFLPWRAGVQSVPGGILYSRPSAGVLIT
jgi:hypothetical protein